MKIDKKLFCFLWMILLFISSMSLSQELPRSFRNQATGNALIDDLDLVYDPIELSFVDSVRIYTNLSNLVSTEEEFMNNSSDNTFLLGISGPFPLHSKLNSSLLVKYSNASIPRNLSIDSDMDGFPDLFGDGDLEDKFVSYMDTDFDGLFDMKAQLDQDKHNNLSNRQQDIYLTGSMPYGSLVIGGRLGYGESSVENSVTPSPLGGFFLMGNGARINDPAFYRQMQVINLDADSVVDNFLEEGDFKNIDQSTYMGFGLSAMTELTLPCGLTEGRIDVGFLKTKDEIDNNNLYLYQKDDYPVVDSYYKNNDQYNLSEISDESIISVGLSLKRIFQPGVERRYDGFWRVAAGFALGSGNFDYTMENPNWENRVQPLNLFQYQSGIDSTLKEDFEQEKITITDKGDLSSLQLSFSGHTQIPLGDRVVFGLGMVYQYRSSTRETVYRDFYESLYSYEVLDDTSTISDYTMTSSYSIGYNRTYEVQSMRFEVPVGLEYAFTNNKKWRIRFGALFICEQMVINDGHDVSDSQPEISRTKMGDGTETVDIDLDDSEYVSFSEHRERVSTQTIYTYGLGFYPTPNLQIDLLGFWGTASNSILDANFWRCLRLSITVGL